MSFDHFTFDEENHVYRLGGNQLPSVTQIIRDLGLTPNFPAGPYRVRGRAVHKACELYDQGVLDQFELAPAIMGYVNAWIAVSKEFGWVWDAQGIEYRLYDPIKMVAGTIDRVGMWGGKPLILDIKSGSAGREAALQTAAYADMRFPDNNAEVQRCSVEIHADGTYAPPKWYTDYYDIIAWRGAVALWRWKMNKETTK